MKKLTALAVKITATEGMMKGDVLALGLRFIIALIVAIAAFIFLGHLFFPTNLWQATSVRDVAMALFLVFLKFLMLLIPSFIATLFLLKSETIVYAWLRMQIWQRKHDRKSTAELEEIQKRYAESELNRLFGYTRP
ncbi:MAG: hypothetical protein JWM20_317 [Patescibacteria group bacterium]|nr:hypothetical protein [Patescibacteria group bacterium]